MVYEFKDPKVPYHKCDVLDYKKISNTRTDLICVVCSKVVATLEDTVPAKKIYPEASNYANSVLEKFK